jgi:Transcriptional regulatory protein, C terminal
MMHHEGQVLSQAQLLNQVWGYDRDPSSNVVEVYVGYLLARSSGATSWRRCAAPDIGLEGDAPAIDTETSGASWLQTCGVPQRAGHLDEGSLRHAAGYGAPRPTS